MYKAASRPSSDAEATGQLLVSSTPRPVSSMHVVLSQPKW